MAFVIEDGSGVADAISYGDTDATTTLAAARSYASDRGIVLPADDAKLKSFLVLATDYIESKASFFVGKPTSFTQGLSWPRSWVRLDANTPFPDNELPPNLLKALYQLCVEQNGGVSLLPTLDPATQGGFVVREKVDVIETQYSERIGTTREPIMAAVDALLSTLMWNSSPFALRSIRV